MNSNDSRINEEVSKRMSPVEDDNLDIEVIKSEPSFARAHVQKEDVVDSFSKDTESNDDHESLHSEEDGSDELLDRIRVLISNKKMRDKVDSGINKLLCNNILNTSQKVSKVDFSIKIIDSRTLSVFFDKNRVDATSMDGNFVDGSEIVYVDCNDQEVDFLILRNINNNELEDVTARYRIKLNNELVPIG